ncbi:MAG TPA: sulfite exporter TauE/SafE family protein [Candidatus Nitrosotalea sp.]|jgi:uncharacterized membrane protein YfcA|nr:sulfite exporter TauE/SafE family protein [Candidatus Nitrosotalea sp.]
MPDALGWLVLGAAALIASTVGGVAGFGTGVIMVPVIAWTLGIKTAVPILTVAMLLGNGARVWFSRRDIQGRVVAAFLAGSVPLTIVGATLFSRAPGVAISRILGVFLLLAVPFRRWIAARGVSVRLGHFPFVGGAFGFLSALVGATGPVISPFFLGYGLRRGAYIATDALCTVGTYAVRLLVFRRHELISTQTVTIGVLLGVVMILGAFAGRRLLDRMSERTFVRLIEIFLLLFGAQFLLFPGR